MNTPRQFWSITGASTKKHPAPFPFELAYRLVRMFSFWGDTVLDPFCGTGTTMLAALKTGRNSVGVEIDDEYCRMALQRLRTEGRDLFREVEVEFVRMGDNGAGLVVQEEPAVYGGKERKKMSKRKAAKK